MMALSKAMPVRISVQLAAAVSLLCAAYALGGSSGWIPIRATIIELIAITALAIALIQWRLRLPLAVVLALVALLMLPLIQLVPLPPSLWHGLGGREIEIDSAEFLGGSQWRPISLDPNATLRAWFSLLAPVALFLTTLQLGARAQRQLLTVFAAIGVVSVLLGMAQVTGNRGLYLFGDAIPGLPSGLFSNRNHQATFLVIAATFSFALMMERPRSDTNARILLGGMAALCIACVLATGSRSGIALAALCCTFAPLVLSRKPPSGRLFFGVILLFAVAAVILLQSGVVMRSLSRFDNIGDQGRFDFWPQVVFAIEHYSPFGSGMGTFARSYQAIEPLGAVEAHYINRAHDDYLELALESGVLGVALLVFVLGVIGRRAWRVFSREPREFSLLARAAVLAIAILLIHSLVDYPARTFANMTACGMFCALLFTGPSSRERSDGKPGRGRLPRAAQIVIAGLALLLAGKATTIGASDAALMRGNPALAASLWPASGEALASQAEKLIDTGDAGAGLAMASRGAAISPQSSTAFRMIARASDAGGRPDLARNAWALAARLGWRDGFVQQWVFEQGLATHNYAAASQAGDAMLRINFQSELVFAGFNQMLQSPAGRAAIAERISDRPDWTGRFIKSLGAASAEQRDATVLFLLELERRNSLPSTINIYSLFSNLLAQGKLNEMMAIWHRLNPGVSGNPAAGVIDGDFSELASRRGNRGPFGWLARPDQGISVDTGKRSDLSTDAILHVEAFVSASASAIVQILALPPGKYELTGDVQVLRGTARNFRWSISCDRQRGRLFLERPADSESGWTTRKGSFEIPPSGCGSQTLRLLVGPTAEEGGEANFDRLRILHSK